MEQQAVSLKQCISEITGKQIAMNGKDFIYLDDKTKVESAVIGEANKLMLQKNKEIRFNEINQKCEFEIISGFPSNALGSTHLYQSARDDQINLMGLVTDGKDDLLKCGVRTEKTEEDGTVIEVITWSWKPHTIEQLKKVFTDGKKYKSELLTKANTLKEQIASAKTVEELEGIVW